MFVNLSVTNFNKSSWNNWLVLKRTDVPLDGSSLSVVLNVWLRSKDSCSSL